MREVSVPIRLFEWRPTGFRLEHEITVEIESEELPKHLVEEVQDAEV